MVSRYFFIPDLDVTKSFKLTRFFPKASQVEFLPVALSNSDVPQNVFRQFSSGFEKHKFLLTKTNHLTPTHSLAHVMKFNSQIYILWYIPAVLIYTVMACYFPADEAQNIHAVWERLLTGHFKKVSD